jgi:hypothetical protein
MQRVFSGAEPLGESGMKRMGKYKRDGAAALVALRGAPHDVRGVRRAWPRAARSAPPQEALAVSRFIQITMVHPAWPACGGVAPPPTPGRAGHPEV